jgi:TrbL/VirB6 plasmid conjugal transfer protein
MKSARRPALRWLLPRRPRRKTVLCVIGFAALLVLLAGPSAVANDVYGNIGPAPQIPAGGLVERYPLVNYQLDQYFPAISVGLTSGVDVSGVAPLIAYFIAQVIWMITAFLAYAVITVFAFAFNLDLLNGNGTPGSGALTPVSTAIHNLYASTFGAPWLVAMVVLVGCWAMWKALVQRRYTETAGALAVSLLYFVLAIGIVTQPERTIGPASKLSNELSTALLSLTNQGSVGNESQAKVAASNQLFELLVVNPWTVLDFGGLEHCTTTTKGKARSVVVRPLSSSPAEDSRLAAQLETMTEIHAQGKTCVNDKNKYAPHFLAFPYQSSRRNSEHDALEKGDIAALPASDPGKTNGTYPLGEQDKPAAEAMGKGGQYQRLLLSIVIFLGELGAFLLLGALAFSVILAQILLLTALGFAPVALLIGILPGRGHEFFRTWLSKLAGYLARKVVYSLILAVLLAVSKALADATSNLGWLLAFALQAAFLWTVFLQRNRLTADFLAATVGPKAGQDSTNRLQTFYYATRLARMARSHHQPAPATAAPSSPSGEAPPSQSEPPPGDEPPPEDGDSPPSSEPPPSGEAPPSREAPPEGTGSSSPSSSSESLAPVKAQAPGEIPDDPDTETAGSSSPPPDASTPRAIGMPAAAERHTGEGQTAPASAAASPPASPIPSERPAEDAPPTGPGAPLGGEVPVLPAPSAPPPGVAASFADDPAPHTESAAPPSFAGAQRPERDIPDAGRVVPSSIPAGSPADEPVQVLLRAREANAASDPAAQGEDSQ